VKPSPAAAICSNEVEGLDLRSGPLSIMANSPMNSPIRFGPTLRLSTDERT
jgi:hypothetical protein